MHSHCMASEERISPLKSEKAGLLLFPLLPNIPKLPSITTMYSVNQVKCRCLIQH